MRVSFEKLFETLCSALSKIGFDEEGASLCARLFAETTRDGVYTHGLNRFPRFLKTIENGSVDIHARPEKVSSMGALERWEGHRGPGNVNAYLSMQHAIELARENGIGCVALANTNHWMRGGSYGWQAADAGTIGICWTNTLPNLPPWGSEEPRLGNNPLVIAVPRAEGHVVLDMAMSQFSFGALEKYRKTGESLPVDGGYDGEGNLTRNAGAIEETGRVLPIGFWKGSGLSLVLDMIAAGLSGGKATHQVPADPELETGISQVFIAIAGDLGDTAERIIEDLRSLNGTRYPGERTLAIRKENMAKGIPVGREVWEQIIALLK